VTIGRRGRIVLGGVAIVVVLGCAAGALLSGRSATSRLAEQFRLDDVSSPEAIADGLLARLPRGSTEAQVDAFLDAARVGADKLSSRFPPNKDGVIVCRIEYDVNTIDLVKESYVIRFRLDADRRLAGVEVKRWLTGL